MRGGGAPFSRRSRRGDIAAPLEIVALRGAWASRAGARRLGGASDPREGGDGVAQFGRPSPLFGAARFAGLAAGFEHEARRPRGALDSLPRL